MLFHRAAERRFAFVVIAFAAVFVTASGSDARAQLPQTRITSVFPIGAKSGETVDFSITGGTDLEEADSLIFSHPGIKAELKSGNNFAVTVGADVPPGVYEVRLHALYGTSNPRCFVVGDLPEVAENDANNTDAQAQAIEIGTTINGRSNGGADVDFFKITAKKGQRLLVECQALRIDSKFQGEIRLYNTEGRRLSRVVALLRRDDPLLDFTVPADGDYLLRVSDFVYGGGNDYVYRLKVHTGPYVDFVVPPAGVPGTTGQYTLYGRNLPGSQTAEIAADGRQLEKLNVPIALPGAADVLDSGLPRFSREAALDGSSYTFKGANGSANPVTIAFAPQPLLIESEPNDEPAQSHRISLPAEVAGAFGKVGDVDRFEFEVKAGSVYWIEVFGQQLGSESDPYLTLDGVTKNADGTEALKRITAQDDTPGNALVNLFDTDTSDVAYRFAVPADGLYRIALHDRFFESRGAPSLQYHLAIRSEAPDYRIAVVPPAPLQNAAAGYQTWALGLRKGENLQIEVAAIRRHGFNGVINVRAEGLPPGVTCPGASIDGSLTTATLVFSASEDVKPGSWPIQLIGSGVIESGEAVAAVTAAEAALKKAVEAVPNLDKALAATVDPLNKAAESAKTAEAAAKADAEVRQKADADKQAADKKLADSQAAQKAADTAKQAADKALADARAAAVKADTALKAAQAELEKDKENQGLKDQVAAAEKSKVDADTAAATADQGAKDAATKLAEANTGLQTATADAQKATAALTQADAKARQTDAAFQKAKAEHDAAAAKNKAASDAKSAGDAAVVASQKELDEKRVAREKAAQTVQHPARTATVVWNGSNVVPATTRLTRNLTLSVINEVSSVQVTSPVTSEVLAHNRTLLVPVKMAKRDGFDDKVQLTFLAVPKNVKATNVAIEKGQDSAVAKIEIPNTVAEGTYTLFLQAQAKVKHQRNLVRLERAKAAQAKSDGELKSAQEAAKAADETAKAAAAQLVTATQAVAAAQQKLTAEQKKQVDAQAAEKVAETEKANTDKAVTDAQAKVDAAVKAETEAKAASDADAANEELKKKLEEASKAKADAETALKAAQDGQTVAAKKLADAQAATKAAIEAATTADTELKTAQAAVTKATEDKKKADDAKTAADNSVKATDAAKKAADKEADDATKNSAAKDVNIFAASTPITIVVKKGAFTLAVNAPNGGALKAGEKIEVKVTVARINGFTGPVTVDLALPPGVNGISSQAVTIPADQTEGVLVVTAAGDAAEGAVAELLVRGSAEWAGPTSADQAVGIKVTK